MSWSVSGGGKSDETVKAIEAQFESYSPCAEPEETIKQAARAIIKAALEANTPPRDVTVSAFGSQSNYEIDGVPTVSNDLSITIS